MKRYKNGGYAIYELDGGKFRKITRRRSWGIAVHRDGRLLIRDGKDRIFISDESKSYVDCENERMVGMLKLCDKSPVCRERAVQMWGSQD